MPDRVIRDELLRSHRYRTLSSDTIRLLFIHLLLHVDSLGNYEANSTTIGDVLHRPVNDSTAAAMLAELADHDLIRLYQVGSKCLLHIPRFRQRLRYLKGRHPRPPPGIECHEIKELIEKVGLKSDLSQVAVTRSEVEVEVKPLKPRLSRLNRIQTSKPAIPENSEVKIAFEKREDQNRQIGKLVEIPKPKTGQNWDNPIWVGATALTFGVVTRQGEDFASFRDRVFAAVQQSQRQAD